MKTLAATLLLALCAAPSLARAEPWSWLRSENRNVREGNERLHANDAKAAIAAYDRAARELPSEGGVHLDRGLALMKSGDLAKARDALRLGTQPPAAAAVRADAYYDLGLAFYKEADARAGENDHAQAQQLFREAADAFKSSLRLRPGDRNTGWNYELAARRIREQEEKQKQEDEKKKQDQQKNDQQKNDQQKQDQEQKQDQQKQDQQKQDQAKNDPKQDQQKQDQQKQDQQKQDQQKQAQQQPEEQARPEVDRALDALQDSEENLERMRAMNRAARERRKPEKDW